jgi:hypothetical protein
MGRIKKVKTITQSAFADLIGVTRGRISQMIKEGIIDREPGGGIDPVKAKKQWKERRVYAAPTVPKAKPITGKGGKPTKNTKKSVAKKTKKEVVSPLGENHDQYISARARSMVAKAAHDELKLKEAQQDIVKKSEFFPVLKAMITRNNAAIKTQLLSLPKRLALAWPDPKQKSIVESVAREIIDQCLVELADIKLEG